MDDRTALRIAVVHSYYSSRQTSGENQVVDQQVDVLRSAGHTVTLVARRTDDLAGHRSYSLKAAATVATGSGPDPLVQLHDFGPDVVLVNNLFPNYGRRWVDRWSGPIVAVMHNYRAMCASGTLFRDGRVCTDCLDRRGGWPAIQHACYRGSTVATVPLAVSTKFGDDPLLRRADRVVVLNTRMRDLYERAGVDAARIRQVPNFLSRPHPAGPGGDGWLFVGRLTQEKGIVPLLRQWPEGVPLTVVGAGPLADEVARVAPAGVVLPGEQPPSHVAELMRTARGLVFPSRWFEGFPMVYLEALAAGTPVLAWEPSAVSSMVREEGTGIVVEDLPLALATAESSFPGLRDRCRSTFVARYTREAWLANMEGLFRELVGHGAR